jgi:pimeloyl-ACP methyl ester carboxylesterase
MSFVTLDGVTLEYRMILGDALGPPLVFLHEGLGSMGLWRDFPDKLARRLSTRALVYSRRGYGKSDALAGPRDTRFMHEEAMRALPALLDRLGMTAPILIGHSDGASIALIHAAQGTRPVTGLVLMAPHVFVEPVTLESIARVAKRYATTDLRKRLANYHSHVDDAFLGWSRAWLDPAFATWSLGAEVQRLTTPTLLIQGMDDEYGTLAQLDAFEVAPAPVQRLVLDQCGHAPWREQEAAVLDAISGFAARLSERGRDRALPG